MPAILRPECQAYRVIEIDIGHILQPVAQQAALFRLGWAYAKRNDKADAVAALQKASAIDGPYQGPAKEMLAKVNAAGKK